MSPIERLNQWLDEAQPGASLNADGTATFLVGNQLEVVVATGDDPSVIMLFTELMPLQGLSDEEIAVVCRHSLLINSHDGLTGDAALALDRHHNRLVFNQSIAWENLDAEHLWAHYDAFAANALTLWATVHGQPRTNAAADEENAAAPDQPQAAVPPPQPWTLA